MGLDGVELVLAVEEEFEIEIDDADAGNITTPRMLADYVVSRLAKVAPSDGSCLSQAGFYRIRSALIRDFGALREDVKPDSPILNFLKGDIRKQWRQLGTAIGASDFPWLKCRKSISVPVSLGVPALVAGLLVLKGHPITALLSFIALWIGSQVVIGRLADIVPDAYGRISALVPYVGVQAREEWNPDTVLRRVIQITSLQLGIPAADIKPDHRFVEDLGLDS